MTAKVNPVQLGQAPVRYHLACSDCEATGPVRDKESDAYADVLEHRCKGRGAFTIVPGPDHVALTPGSKEYDEYLRWLRGGRPDGEG